MNNYDLNGRLAVITGGAQGIGFAVAQRFIASGAGVMIWDQDDAQGQAAVARLGQGAAAMPVDVADANAVKDAAEKTKADYGSISILITCAGVAGSNAKLVAYDPDEWKSIIDINLNGTFNCCRAVVPSMMEQGYGRIVTVASVAGKEGNPNAAAYSASKAGVIALTKSLGKEHAAKTRIFDQMSQKHIDYMLSKIPRGRFLQVEEAAQMITWLSTSENSFTTGSVFDLSGGRATY